MQLGESRLLVVACYQDMELSRQHPLSESLAELTRQPVFRRELLRGLSQQDTEHFIEATTGFQPPQQLVDTLYTHTEGNPISLVKSSGFRQNEVSWRRRRWVALGASRFPRVSET